MAELALDILALLLLAVAFGLGYWRWIRPRVRGLSLSGTGLLLLLVATLSGGLLGSPFWWLDQKASFAWDLPPLASRMLAAAGLAFAVVAFRALEQPRYPHNRLVLLLLAVYLAPLFVAALLFHRDRFNFHAPITYGFVVIGGSMAAMALWYLWRQPRLMVDLARLRTPANAIRTMLGLLAVICGAWGLALFLTDSGPFSQVWAWPGDLLSGRLIAAMLLAIAAGAWFSRGDSGTARLMLWMTLTYGLGLGAASAWSALDGKPVKLGYLLVFGGIALVSALALTLNRQPSLAAEA